MTASITAVDIRRLGRPHPDGTYCIVYAYVNGVNQTRTVVARGAMRGGCRGVWGERVICLPDKYLAANVINKTTVKILFCDGACEVDKRLMAREVSHIRVNGE